MPNPRRLHRARTRPRSASNRSSCRPAPRPPARQTRPEPSCADVVGTRGAPVCCGGGPGRTRAEQQIHPCRRAHSARPSKVQELRRETTMLAQVFTLGPMPEGGDATLGAAAEAAMKETREAAGCEGLYLLR